MYEALTFREMYFIVIYRHGTLSKFKFSRELNVKCLTIQQIFCASARSAYAFHFISFSSFCCVSCKLLRAEERRGTIFFHAKSSEIILYYDMILNETAWRQKLRILFDLNRFRFLYGLRHPFLCSRSRAKGFYSICSAVAQ